MGQGQWCQGALVTAAVGASIGAMVRAHGMGSGWGTGKGRGGSSGQDTRQGTVECGEAEPVFGGVCHALQFVALLRKLVGDAVEPLFVLRLLIPLVGHQLQHLRQAARDSGWADMPLTHNRPKAIKRPDCGARCPTSTSGRHSAGTTGRNVCQRTAHLPALPWGWRQRGAGARHMQYQHQCRPEKRPSRLIASSLQGFAFGFCRLRRHTRAMMSVSHPLHGSHQGDQTHVTCEGRVSSTHNTTLRRESNVSRTSRVSWAITSCCGNRADGGRPMIVRGWGPPVVCCGRWPAVIGCVLWWGTSGRRPGAVLEAWEAHHCSANEWGWVGGSTHPPRADMVSQGNGMYGGVSPLAHPRAPATSSKGLV